jgi:hypothetical protein
MKQLITALTIKLTFLVMLLVFLTGIGCRKKDHQPEEPKYCWGVLDGSGVPIGKICNRTETEMKDSLPNACYYYKLGDEEFCWLVDSSMYIENVPKNYIKQVLKCYNKTSYKKVTCGYCQSWYTRQKNTYKPANTVTYSPVRVQRLCGDTVKTLYQGRQITLRETSDSLIVLQFSKNASF